LTRFHNFSLKFYSFNKNITKFFFFSFSVLIISPQNYESISGFPTLGVLENKSGRKQESNKAHHIPKVNPGRFANPCDGSKKTSRDDEARSSKIETKSGGSKGLPLAIYMALIAYLDKHFKFSHNSDTKFKRKYIVGLP
jgi:hypothetical protein